MKKKIIVLLSVLLISCVLRLPVLAHPRNTDKYGCHTCRTNCEKWGLSYGEYHCHNKKTTSTSVKSNTTSLTNNDVIILEILILGGVYLIIKFGSFGSNK